MVNYIRAFDEPKKFGIRARVFVIIRARQTIRQ